MKRFFSLLFITAFGVFCAFMIFLLTLNEDSLKNTLLAVVQRETGRGMTVSKGFRVYKSLFPEVEMSGVRLFNPDGFSTPLFIEAERITATVSPLSFVTGAFVLNELTLKGVTLNFEKNAKGADNWHFKPVENDDADEDDIIAGEEDVPEKIVSKIKTFFKNKKIVVKKVSFINAGFSYVDQKRKMMYQMFVPSAKLMSEKSRTVLFVETKIQGKKIEFQGETSAPEALFDDNGTFDFKWTVKGFKTHAMLAGNVTGGLQKGSIDADVSLSSDAIEKFALLYGKKIPAFKKAELKAKLTGNRQTLAMPVFSLTMGTPETAELTVSGAAESVYPVRKGAFDVSMSATDFGRILNNGIGVAPFSLTAKASAFPDGYALSDIVFKAREADMSGDFFMKTGDANGFSLSLVSQRADLSKLFYTIKDFVPVPDEYQSAQFVTSNERLPLFSQKPFPLDFLRKTSGKADISFNDLTLSDGDRAGAISVRAQMENGFFRLAPVRFQNRFALEGDFNARPAVATARFSLKTNNFPIASFLALRGVTEGLVTANVDLTASGNSPAQMAETLKGKLLVFAKDIFLSHAAFQKLQAFLPPSDDITRRPGLKADCLVVNANVQNGVLFSEKQIALQSDVLNVQASGSVMLPVEKVDLNIDTGFKGRDVIKAMSGTLKMKGDLRKPSLSFDAVSKFQRTLDLGMGALFGGMKGAQQALEPTVPNNACAIALGQK